MILKVARLGHPALRQVAEPVPEELLRSAEFQRLIDDMVETMREYEGVGLAAPQVHVSRRLFVAEVPEEEGKAPLPLTVAVNPRVTFLGDERGLDWEGCLSLPELRGQVPRHRRIRLEALDREGKPFRVELSEFPARVVQHEWDHLDGVVFLERMSDLRSLSYLAEFRRFWAQTS